MTSDTTVRTVKDRVEIVEEDIPDGKQYHAMFSYRNLEKETTWVRNTILTLEEDYNIKCCHHERDFTYGKEIANNITECLEQSSKVVIVLSKEYMNSQWCKLELHSSFFKSNNEGKVAIIPIVIEDCDISEFLKPLTHIDAREEKNEWLPKLAFSILRPGKEVGTPELILKEQALRWNSLTILHNTEVVLACNGSASVFDKYIPDNLKSNGIEVPSSLYGDILDNIASTQLVKGRHCRFPSGGAMCCWILMFAVCSYFAMNGLIRGFPQDYPDFIGIGLFIILFPALIGLIWLPICIATTQMGKVQLEKVLTDANYKLMKYNVLVTFLRKKSFTDHLKTLFKRHCSNNLEYNSPISESTIVEMENVVSDSSITLNDEVANVMQPLLNNENIGELCSKDTAVETDPIRLVCSRFIAEYLQTYIRKELPTSDECHTKKVICLCKYISLHWKEKHTQITKDEQNVLSIIFAE